MLDEDTIITDTEIKVQKRNGIVVGFKVERISCAVGNAFKQAEQLPREMDLPPVAMKHVEKVTECVYEVLQDRAKTKNPLDVEDIQDEVIRQLYENGYKEVASVYANYRREHAARRTVFDLYKVRKRDGKTVSFKPEKIAMAIAKAFQAVNMQDSEYRPLEAARRLGTQVVGQIRSRWPEGRVVDIEAIQDMVEEILMDNGYFKVARQYIVYREARKKDRSSQPTEEASYSWAQEIEFITSLGEKKKLDIEALRFTIETCCQGLDDVDSETVLKEAVKNYYQEITEAQISISNIMATRSFIEKEPNYSSVAARLLLLHSYREGIGHEVTFGEMKVEYPRYFLDYIPRAVELGLVSEELLDYDLNKLAKSIVPERDFSFKYLGIQTLYDRYFIHWEERRLELPQIFWMRVAMGLAVNEGEKKEERAIEFYNMLSTLRFVSSTPTLFNAGTRHPQLSSCYLTTIDDDLHHIFKCIQDDAMLSKWSGGLGNDWTNVRAMGSRIKGTNGKSQGIIPFLKVANDTALAVNQGGKRKGAMCAYLETWHMDIHEFLELRKNTGDDRRRTHDMHLANWIPDLFMKRVKLNQVWTLFSPHDTPELHHLYGKEFEAKYTEYEQKADTGEIKHFSKIQAVDLWRKMLSMLFETGHPWITFKDPSNVRSPQDHVGVVHSSNLCTEILLNTSKDETAVCNLGSVNLAVHVTEDGIDYEKLGETIAIAVRMLDNVIDVNYYPTEEAKNANLKHRPVGLGVMGYMDALYTQNINICSDRAVEFADESMEAISYYAILGSSALAAERGTYETYEGSKWSRGILPIDSIDLLEQERGVAVRMDRSMRMDWNTVRDAVKKDGMRNSNVMAIAPTATIANITGVNQSIEPLYKNIFVKSNLSGEFTIANDFLVRDLKKIGLWDDEMINDLKYFDGSVQEVERVPQELKEKYVCAFEIDHEWVLDAASRRQKWIDMGQSLNLYQDGTSGKKLSDMYMYAWEVGLKTTYYLRSLGATRIEKSTLDASKYKNTIGRKVRTQEEAEPDIEESPQVVAGDFEDDCEACQ